MHIYKLLDASVFVSLLRASISHWRQQGKKGVWIKLPIDLVTLFHACLQEGFYLHQAEPKYLMLVYCIPETAYILPANATHRVCIDAFVMNGKKEVLMVQEKRGMLRGTAVWKFPTRVVEEGADICDAAAREVREETRIETKFVEILAFRVRVLCFSISRRHILLSPSHCLARETMKILHLNISVTTYNCCICKKK
ncbi:nudix hydrolase 2-like [Rhododendron vialii]|uniref:nudix hydrolase 2-like n=1 Tax=Rhododendron vialii TaxID=182163 RepID=UPI00265ECE78|nr:nudix hydrolase 2-like [Rhododendron vialii]